MTLLIFSFLLALCIIFIAIGWWQRRDEMRGLAYTLMFILMMSFFTVGVQVPTGHNTTIINASVTTEVTNYEQYTNRAMSFWFVLIPLFGFILMMVERQEDKNGV